ncbi:MAG: hypothetical protein MI867_02500 [Pseudomonadales bacterium]|nr:hypothetical protein [Pseudomonadales bacterium]
MSMILIDTAALNSKEGASLEGSSLKWLRAMEANGFDQFNQFDSHSADGKASNNEHQQDELKRESIDVEGPSRSLNTINQVNADEMAVRLTLLSGNNSNMPPSSVNKVDIRTPQPTGSFMQSGPTSNGRIANGKPLNQTMVFELVKKDIPEEFIKTLETPTGITLLVRNYFKQDQSELYQWVYKLRTLIKDATGEDPMVLVNGTSLDSVKEK